MRSRSLFKNRERGAGPITAILIMGFVALLVAAALVGFGGVARAEQSQAQNAADAAALAGAGFVLDDLPNQLLKAPFSDPGGLQGDIGQPGCVQLGRASAEDLAAENDAVLTSYCWSASRTEVSVSVRLDHAAKGQPATAQAVADPGISLSDCKIDPGFVPPTPEPPAPGGDDNGGDDNGGDGKDPKTPAPPSPIDTSVNCGFGDLSVSYDPATQLFTFSAPGQIRSLLDGLKPRLVG